MNNEKLLSRLETRLVEVKAEIEAKGYSFRQADYSAIVDGRFTITNQEAHKLVNEYDNLLNRIDLIKHPREIVFGENGQIIGIKRT